MPETTWWLTKYALAGGVRQVVAREGHDIDWVYPQGFGMSYKIGRDVFATREEAVADAEKRRVAKIKALRRQIEKLEGMRFDG